MSKPDLQYFDADGTWVKPGGAHRVTVVLVGGDGGSHFTDYTRSGGVAATGFSAGPAETGAWSFSPGIVADLVSVEIGDGGWALVITHLEPERPRLRAGE